MAIAHVQTQSTDGGTVSVVTHVNFAVGAGADRSLVAFLLWVDLTGGGVPTGSSVVFNTTETFTYGHRSQLNYAGDNYITAEVWYLDNPSNATANVVGTISEEAESVGIAISEYTGANNGVSATGQSSGNAAAQDVSITTNNSDSLIVTGCAAGSGGSSYTPDGATVERLDYDGTSWMMSAFEEAATGGADLIEIDRAASARFAHVAIELLAAAGAPGRTTKNTDPYGLGIESGISRTFKVHG